MAKPVEEVVEQLAASGLFTADEVRAFLDNFPPYHRPADGDALLDEIVTTGKLTEYQASVVRKGKTKGLVLGAYTLLARIGEGGMGQVYKARHRRMKRIVALKILPAGAVDSEAAIARFHREMEAMAKLDHPNVVIAHDAGEADGVHFLVMQYVDGEDLSSMVHRRGALPVAEASHYLLQAARGLAYAHDEGVIHRDLKPSNLLVDKKGTLKVLDMGLARLADTPHDAATADQLTGTGQIMGTVDYMSPEQAENTKNADRRSDIYSLGCTFHSLLTSRAMYEGESVVEKIIAHRERPVRSLCDMREDVPPRLDAIFQKMVAKRPDDRYQSMAELADELAAVIEKEGLSAAPGVGPALGATMTAVFEQGLSGPPGPARHTHVQGATAAVVETEVATSGPKYEETHTQYKAAEDTETQYRPLASPKRRRRKRQHKKLFGTLVLLSIGGTLGYFLSHEKYRDRVYEMFRGSVDAKTPNNPYVKLRTTFDRHTQGVTCLAFSPDGLTMASGAGDEVKILEVEQHVDRRTLRHHTTGVSSVAFSPDGRMLATAGGAEIRTFFPHSGQKRAELADLEHFVSHVAFSPDSSLLAAAADDVKLFDAETGIAKGHLQGHVGAVSCVAFSPDGKTILSGGDDQTVRLWDVKTLKLRQVLKQHTNSVWHVGYSPDGALFASAGADETICLWDADGGNLWHTLRGHAAGVSCVAFSPDGNWLASASHDGTVRLWNTKDGTLITKLAAHKERVWTVAVSPDGSLMATGSADKTIKLWNLTVELAPTVVVEPQADVDLARLVDIERDSIQGDWQREKEAILSPGEGVARLQLPYAPPSEYDLTIVAEPVSGNQGLVLGLVVDGRRALVVLGLKGETSGLILSEGFPENETRYDGGIFAAGRTTTVTCKVRKDRIEVDAGGKQIIRFAGDMDRLGTSKIWQVPKKNSLLVGSAISSYRIHKIVLRPVRGAGKILAE